MCVLSLRNTFSGCPFLCDLRFLRALIFVWKIEVVFSKQWMSFYACAVALMFFELAFVGLSPQCSWVAYVRGLRMSMVSASFSLVPWRFD